MLLNMINSIGIKVTSYHKRYVLIKLLHTHLVIMLIVDNLVLNGRQDFCIYLGAVSQSREIILIHRGRVTHI